MNTRWLHYAIWLLPERKIKEKLARLIHSLSHTVGAIPFAPHLTLCSGTNESEGRIQAVLQTAISGLPALSLRVTGVNVSADFFQTLFLEFAANDALLQLHAQLRQALTPQKTTSFHPHLSLLYYDADLAEKERLRALVPTIPETITFDRVSLVVTTSPQGWRDIASWKRLSSQSLT
ncbi:MAG TPA: 2'-5' RNA ligase family protein [Blastocatellia bacterium]|nr:2'-5' RNA ligase family protein [Blastocatellia bacterium]